MKISIGEKRISIRQVMQHNENSDQNNTQEPPPITAPRTRARTKLIFQNKVPKPKPRSSINLTRSTDLTKLEALFEKRLNKHHLKMKAKEVLSDSNGPINFSQLLESLDELSAYPQSGKLLKDLTERDRQHMPPFLTVRDLDNGLKCTVDRNKHAVYAVTITIPIAIYERMKDDPIMEKREVVKTAHIDRELVYLRGKIGETTNFPSRARDYYADSAHRYGEVCSTLTYLREQGTDQERISSMGGRIANLVWKKHEAIFYLYTV